MKKYFIFTILFFVIACMIFTKDTLAQIVYEDFEDESLLPFNVEIAEGNISQIVTPSDFQARSGDRVHRIVWSSENYNGARSGRSVEGSSYNQTRIKKEGWYGFSFYAPDTFPLSGKAIVLGQVIAWHPSLPRTNISIVVSIEPSGHLILTGAYGEGDGGKVTTVNTTIASKVSNNSWHDVVLYFRFSRNNQGVLKAWFDGDLEETPTVSYTGINLGNGGWDNDDQMTHGAYIKWGPYNWDVNNYSENDIREIFYDDIAYTSMNIDGAFDSIKSGNYGIGYALPDGGDELFRENFDQSMTGQWPNNWIVKRNSNIGNGLFIRDTPSVADKSLQFWDDNPLSKIEAIRYFPKQTDSFKVNWSFMQNGGNSAIGEGQRMALLSRDMVALELVVVNDSLVFVDDLGNENILANLEKGQWYAVDIIVDLPYLTASIYIDGERKLNNINFQKITSMFDGVLFGTSDESKGLHLYINNFNVSRLPPVFSVNFNDQTTPSKPQGWEVHQDQSTNTAIRDFPSITNKSMQFWDANEGGYVEVSRSFIPQNRPFAVSWKFRQQGLVEGHKMKLLKGKEKSAIEMVTDSNGSLLFQRSNGTFYNLGSVEAKVWHDVKVVVRPSTNKADVYLNGTLRRRDTPLLNNIDFVDRIEFGSSPDTLGPHLYVDDIVVEVGDALALEPLAQGFPKIPIVLKLDDLGNSGCNYVSDDWRRVTNFAASRGIKISIGLIAQALECHENHREKKLMKYIRKLDSDQLVDLWFHGYDHSSMPTKEFFNSGYAFQKARFVNSQELAQRALGRRFTTFGAPFNKTDADTEQVLKEDLNIKIWLFGDTEKPAGKEVLKRVDGVNIEIPTFVPNPEKFVEEYKRNAPNNNYFVIQGHPGNWGANGRYMDFIRLVDYLQDNDIPIVSASDLVDE